MMLNNTVRRDEAIIGGREYSLVVFLRGATPRNEMALSCRKRRGEKSALGRAFAEANS